MAKGHLLHFAVFNLPEVEDIPRGPGAAHVDAEGDQAALGGEEEHLPHGELLVVEVARQLHSLDCCQVIFLQSPQDKVISFYLAVQIF